MWTPRRFGEVIDGRYEIIKGPNERRDLMGGMGCVYICVDRLRHRSVALKTFRPELTGHSVRDHLLREAATWVRLGNHPNIVQAYGLCCPDDGNFYIVLQLIGAPSNEIGTSLRAQAAILADPSRALVVALHVARGMRYATQRVHGLVHRDLKPENILVGDDGVASVTDFGLAQTVAALNHIATQDGSLRRTLARNGIGGTPLYMAPEQWLTTSVDERADIYALGCILKELVTGRSPVPGESVDDVGDAHLRGCAADLAGVPSALQGPLRRMLALAPEQRYSSWAEVTEALEETHVVVNGRSAPAAPLSESSAKDEAYAFLTITAAYLRIGSRSAAAEALKHARRLSESINDPLLTANTVDAEAGLLLESGQPKEAVPMLRWVGDWYLHNKQLSAAARSLGTLGQAQRKLGDLTAALRSSDAALDVLRALEDRRAMAVELLHKANTHGLLKELDKALDCHKESALLADAVGDEALVGMNTLRMGLMFAMSSTATASRVCLRYANLLYVRSGRDDYAAEVKGIFDQFIKAGLFSDDPFELDLDALFEVPPDPRAIAELVVRRPDLLDPGLINTLTSASAAAVGTECAAKAIREQGTILAAVAQLASRRT